MNARTCLGALLTLTLAGFPGRAAAAPTSHPSAGGPEPSGGASPVARRAPGPRLVVLVVVDQLRADLLDRYDDLWTGGFRRLRDQGFRFTGASHDHAYTQTAPGHATLGTGSTPAHTGIVSNEWWEAKPGGRWAHVYAVSDSLSPIVGLPGASGRSPANLARGGLADWILAAHPDARVVSISKKDRAAVTMAGRAHDAQVYWVDPPTGRWVTSTWYRKSYPGWVRDFNRDVMPGVLADTVWTSRVPPVDRGRSRPDTSALEKDGVHTAFPHHAWSEVKTKNDSALNVWVSESPAMDGAILGMGLKALDALHLGHGPSVDYLALSFSATDYVGHDYGPSSREQLDNLLRLDGRLGRLFDALDRDVGKGRWVLAFSADHGELTLPEWSAREGGPKGFRIGPRERREIRSALDRPGRDAEARAEAAERLPFVAAAYPIAELAKGAAPDSFAVLFEHALFPGRYPSGFARSGVELRLVPGALQYDEPRGTSHGSPYWYDRHVPLVFMGGGIRPGSSEARAYTFDVAPTLAALAGVPVPADVDGHPLSLERGTAPTTP